MSIYDFQADIAPILLNAGNNWSNAEIALVRVWLMDDNRSELIAVIWNQILSHGFDKSMCDQVLDEYFGIANVECSLVPVPAFIKFLQQYPGGKDDFYGMFIDHLRQFCRDWISVTAKVRI